MAEIPIIPRKVLFGNPDKASPSISSDGKHIAFLAPKDGVLNVWIAPTENPDNAKPITSDTKRGIRFYEWARAEQYLFYIQDKDGDENWHLFVVNIQNGKIHDLTPFENIQARILKSSPEFPKNIIVAINRRDPQWHDVYNLNIETGKLELVLENETFADFELDDDYNIVFGYQLVPEGIKIMKPLNDGQWEHWETISEEDQLTTDCVTISKDGKYAYLRGSRNRDTSTLVKCKLSDKSRTILAEHPRADIDDVLIHPIEKYPLAASFTYARKEWKILDENVNDDFEKIKTFIKGDFNIESQSLDNRYWVISDTVDDGPINYYIYDRETKSSTFLFANKDVLKNQPLAKMYSKTIKSHDGLDLVIYYTLPLSSDSDGKEIPDKPVPTVLLPHGGPWGRDFWGYDPLHQWLANRGYAVISVNFRSSTGFGKSFINAGDREWGGKIIQDQADTVKWAIDKGIADPDKVAIMGGSFGGYSTLAGLTFFPELYTCGVDIVGPSNLETFLDTIPAYWKPMFEMLTNRVGDPRTKEGKELLKKHSPLNYVDNIKAPLLIGQGANDPRVKKAESDQIAEVMKEKNIPVTYVLYPDEGHGFARPENRLSFFAVAEAFLAKFLGGSYEPIGEDFKKSSIQILSGKEKIPGLKKALDNKEKN
ncbi:MAG: S9 family peptidase [Thermotogota bacterium]|nr:S9 family peptidase [Thermotogota bacterium]